MSNLTLDPKGTRPTLPDWAKNCCVILTAMAGLFGYTIYRDGQQVVDQAEVKVAVANGNSVSHAKSAKVTDKAIDIPPVTPPVPPVDPNITPPVVVVPPSPPIVNPPPAVVTPSAVARLETEEVNIEQAGSGLVVYFDATETKDDRLVKTTWENNYPVGMSAPMRARDDNGRQFLFFRRTLPGQYKFLLRVQVEDPKLDPIASDNLLVKVGPQIDVPPITPTPTPTPGQVIGTGFRVLVLRDRNTEGLLDRNVAKAIQSQEPTDYMDARCAKNANGDPEWRYWDDSTNPDDITDSPGWKEAYQKALVDSKDANGVSHRPWIIASDGKVGSSVEFKFDLPSYMAFLKQYGG